MKINKKDINMATIEETVFDNTDLIEDTVDIDEQELEENYKNQISEMCDDDEEEIEDDADEEEMMEEEVDIDFSKIAESLGLKDAKSVKNLQKVFETALELKVNEAEAKLTKQLKNEALEAVKHIKEEITADMRSAANAYVTMIVNEWISENEITIQDNLVVERSTRMVESIKGILEENAITIDEDTSNIVDSLRDANEHLSEELEELSSTKDEYRALLEDVAKLEEVRKYNLTESQEVKVNKIVKGFSINEDFSDKVKSLVGLVTESTKKPETKTITESLEETFVQPQKIKNEDVVTEGADLGSFLNSLINK